VFSFFPVSDECKKSDQLILYIKTHTDDPPNFISIYELKLPRRIWDEIFCEVESGDIPQ
jgi:hypothetical protein